MKVLGPILLIVISSLIIYSVWVTIAWRTAVTRLKGMDDWRAWLPKSERIKYAREMLADALEQQDMLQQERLTQIIGNPFEQYTNKKENQ